MTLTQLETRIGVATTTHGGQISVAAALRTAADAEVLPDGSATAAGSWPSPANRYATSHQRRALGARDGGCSFPGCDAPPGWAETHHIRHWSSGGNTDLDNLTLVCGYHHREHERMGWGVSADRRRTELAPALDRRSDRIPRPRHHDTTSSTSCSPRPR